MALLDDRNWGSRFIVLSEEVAVAWLVGEAVWAETGRVGGQRGG